MINRRIFIKRLFALAAGMGLASCTPPVPSQPSPASTQAGVASNPLLFAGSYTESGAPGISRFQFDPASGLLTFLDSTPAGDNPSFLAAHPSGRYLYAVNEISSFQGKPGGAVSAFAIDPASGKLSALNQQPSMGESPCHLATDRTGQALLVANYTSGTVALLPITADGSLKAAAVQVQHTGKGPNLQRQEGPHAHFIAPDPGNRYALSCDLGIDKVLVYRLDAAGGRLQAHGEAILPPGLGPRHLDFSPAGNAAYVINELNSTLTVFAYDAATGTLSSLQTLSTLPEGASGTNAPAPSSSTPPALFFSPPTRTAIPSRPSVLTRLPVA